MLYFPIIFHYLSLLEKKGKIMITRFADERPYSNQNLGRLCDIDSSEPTENVHACFISKIAHLFRDMFAMWCARAGHPLQCTYGYRKLDQ